MRKALVIVGVQNDYCPGGVRAVPDADRVIVPLSALGSAIDHAGDLIVVQKEIHRASSPYFKEQGGDVDSYCVEGTRGAAFHPALALSKRTRQVFRSLDPQENGASAFLSVDRSGSRLVELLRAAGAEEIFLGGLPVEEAIRATALDGLRRGFRVTVIQDGVASFHPHRGREILSDLRMLGARVLSSGQAILSLYQSGECRL